MIKKYRWSATGAVLLLYLFVLPVAFAQTNRIVYSDSLSKGWANWSWAKVDLANTSHVHSGSKSIAVAASGWEALYFHHEPFDPALVESISFWIHGGTSGGQLLMVQAVYDGTAVDVGAQLDPLPANAWVRIQIPMARLVPPGQKLINGFWIQNRGGHSGDAFYVDDVELKTGFSALESTNALAIVTVDAAAHRHPISPEIYGVAFASSEQLSDLNVPLNRWGGNSTTRYNWQLNASSAAADWFFESIASTNLLPGEQADEFVLASKTAGAQAMLTIPMIGWVARLGPDRERLASFSIAKYGSQMSRDKWFPDAGNGIASPSARPITNNNPNDANMPADLTFHSNWVVHLVQRWGRATNGGLRYYLLDNEPSLWHSTHRDVHPSGQTMDELIAKSVSYSSAIKDIDPGAFIVGPEEWGWPGYFRSGSDQQWSVQHGFKNLPDRARHSGWDYLPWFLDQMRRHSTASGRRLLDVFTVHYYPQNGEFSRDVSVPMQLSRNRSTRALWDTSYVDPSWIKDKVMLIPRIKQWVQQYYPGTRIGITEYNWGADNHMNGATAQADVLGIFGRENLDLAARWEVPHTGTPTYNAIKMYRNYDGNNSTFGEINVSAVTGGTDELSAFAALRKDGALTVMVVNKVLAGTTPLSLVVSHFTQGQTAQVWQLASGNPIARLPELGVVNGSIQTALPSQSITLFVLSRIQK